MTFEQSEPSGCLVEHSRSLQKSERKGSEGVMLGMFEEQVGGTPEAARMKWRAVGSEGISIFGCAVGLRGCREAPGSEKEATGGF